jgi:hypothetical protein
MSVVEPARRFGTIGFLEHVRATRFHVPKITFIVTPSVAEGLENQAELKTKCSKNARIRATGISREKFQNPPPQPFLGWSSTAGCPTVVTHELDTNEPGTNVPRGKHRPSAGKPGVCGVGSFKMSKSKKGKPSANPTTDA